MPASTDTQLASALSRAPVPAIVAQHAEDASSQRGVRSVLLRAPHVNLLRLARLDERLAASLDGLAVSGAAADAVLRAMLDPPSAGVVFALAVGAIETHDEDTLDRLIALAAGLPDAWRGLLSAFGWVSAAQLRGTVQALLGSKSPIRRALGLSACRLHGVDAGAAIEAALRDGEPRVVEAGVRLAADLGRIDLVEPVRALIARADPDVASRASFSAVLLGDVTALPRLSSVAMGEGDLPLQALALVMLASDSDAAAEWLKQLAADARDPAAPIVVRRRLVRAVGLLGDSQRVPWLIEVMRDDRLSQLAGEAFSLLTGADLAALDLERKPPENAGAGPNEEPEDTDVALDEDESLPWPDVAAVQAWWRDNEQRFQTGARYFVGAAPSLAHCLQVLNTGYQRQRIAAAHYRCLLRPGTPLFNCAAPVARQKRLLAAMS
jgi:uncharacterized protein (TIGR02270 family)